MVSQVSYVALNLVSTDNSVTITKLSNGNTNLQTAGGGGTPASPTTAVQFNNAGSFGGDAGFTFTGTGTSGNLTVGNVTGVTSSTGATSPTLTVQTGAPTATQNGGALTVKTPNATAATKAAGGITIQAGNGLTSGLGGSVSIVAGSTPTSYTSGSVSLTGGSGFGGGSINLTGGTSTSGATFGGGINLIGGPASNIGGGIAMSGGSAPTGGTIAADAGTSSIGNGAGASFRMFGGNTLGAGGSGTFYGGDAGPFNGQVGGSFSFTTGLGDSGANNGAITFSTPIGQALKFSDDTISAVQIGFYGTTPVAKPTVTGSRATGAALVSLLTQLASLGLITDSTTT